MQCTAAFCRSYLRSAVALMCIKIPAKLPSMPRESSKVKATAIKDDSMHKRRLYKARNFICKCCTAYSVSSSSLVDTGCQFFCHVLNYDKLSTTIQNKIF